MAAHPPLTLQDPCLVLPVKIQFMTSSHWPDCCLSLSERLWLKHSLKHSQTWLPCWWKSPAVGQTRTRRIGRTTSICSIRPLQPWLILFSFCCFVSYNLEIFKILFIFNHDQVISHMLIGSFLSLLLVGNHLGAMVHQRWAEHTLISVSGHFNALWMYF